MALTRQGCKLQEISCLPVFELPPRTRKTKMSTFSPLRTERKMETCDHDYNISEKPEVLTDYSNYLDWSVDCSWRKLVQPTYDRQRDLTTEIAQAASLEYPALGSGSRSNSATRTSRTGRRP